MYNRYVTYTVKKRHSMWPNMYTNQNNHYSQHLALAYITLFYYASLCTIDVNLATKDLTSSFGPTCVFQSLCTLQERRLLNDGAEKLRRSPVCWRTLHIQTAALSPRSIAGRGVALTLQEFKQKCRYCEHYK